MMASPASTAGFALADDRDPWDWTTEDTVDCLCSPNQPNFPDPTSFAETIRENRLWGGALLTQVDYENLKEDLGVRAMGERSAVLMLIRKLRLRSAKYRQHAQETSSLAALSQSQYQANLQVPPITAPLLRYLNEPMEPPHDHDVSALPLDSGISADQPDPKRLRANEIQVTKALSPEEVFEPLDSPPLNLDHNSEADLDPVPEPRPGPGPHNFHHTGGKSPEHTDKRLSAEDVNSRTLRAGETYVVDETGCKRRRLQLGPPETNESTLQDPADANKTLEEAQETTADPTQDAEEEQPLNGDPSVQYNGLQTTDDTDETKFDPEVSTSANIRLVSPQVLTANEKLQDMAEDCVVLEVDTPRSSSPSSPDALAAAIVPPLEETISALQNDQAKAAHHPDQVHEESAPPLDMSDETQAVHDADGSNGMQSAPPDSSMLLNRSFGRATDAIEHSDIDERSSGLEQLETAESCEEPTSKPGVVVVDAKGRKRVMPTLIEQLSVEHRDERSPTPVSRFSAEGVETEARTSTVEDKEEQDAAVVRTPLNIRKRGASQMYLGLKAFPVDEIFYGDTAMGQKITFSDSHRAIAPLRQECEHPDNWVLLSENLSAAGRRIYVNNRMKYFLTSKPILLRGNEPQVQYGVVPYPTRILQKHQPLSLTLFSNSASDGATRARRPAWLAADNPIPPSQPYEEQLDGIHTFEVPQASSLLSHLGENEIRDFDYLEKWNHQENGEDVLPLYGDSASEGEYDLDTWQEMEAEQSTSLERPVGKSNGKHLTADEVSDIIEDSIEQMSEEWKTKKLPLMERKAWRLWVRARHDKSVHLQIATLLEDIEKLEHRLAKLKKELNGEVWSNALQLKKQCQSLQLTINDLEASKWKIETLQLRHAPPKPERSSEKPESGKAEKTREPVPDGEEELESSESACESSDEDLEDFIVEDDNELDDGLDGGSLDLLLDDNEHIIAQTSPGAVAHGDHTINTHSHLRNFTATTPDYTSQDVTKDELTTPEDLVKDVTHERDPSATLPGLELFNRKNSASQGDTHHEVIDLTQLSDPDTLEVPASSAPKIKKESYRMRTPPTDTTDPFRRARKAKSEFREPPMASHIVNIEDEEQSQNQKLPSPSKNQLPDLSELRKLRALKWELLSERQDRKRLLTWIMLHTPADTLEDVLTATQHKVSAEIQPSIWRALKAIKGHATKLREDSSGGLMQVASWYVNWHTCKVFMDGIPPSSLASTITDETGFEGFYNFMLEAFSELEADKLSKASISTVGKPPGKKRQIRLDGDPETRLTPHKKRKYAVPESQEAAQLRFSAQERARERTERQTLLHRQLGQSGMGSGNTAAMIVNGKSGDDMITIHPEIGRRIQPHQLDGIQFMWGEIVSDQAEMQGCLLAHTMGLGKTMQVITLLVTIADAAHNPSEAIRSQVPEALKESRTLVLCPPGLVENWSDELLMWIPPTSSINIGEIRKISAKLSSKDRLFEITEWGETGGILILGYSMFKSLVLNKRKSKSDETSSGLNEEQRRRISSILLERPNIVIADEAHAAKSANTNLTQAVAKIRSRSRIALTGSPLANNLEEYYSIIEWIAPGYLGSRTEFRAKYVEPIRDGLFADATQYEKRKGLKMLQVLKAELAPKVHRLDISVLKNILPGKTEFVLRVPLTDIQYEAYSIYARHMLNATTANEPGSATLWGWLSILGLLCNHPLCFINKLEEKQTGPKPTKKESKRLLSPAEEAVDPIALEENTDLLLEGSITQLRIPGTMVEEEIALFKKIAIPIKSVELSFKMEMLFLIIRHSVAVGDKILIFSHSLPTLDYIERLLSEKGYKYSRLDGKTNMQTRQELTKDFNQNKNVCIISTKAGGQGLNMAGANRVVIMDASFNPMHEEQAIGRAYRIGQKKHVFVYRLLVGGTFEQALHDQSLFKTQLATRVVDKKNPVRHTLKGSRQYLFLPKRLEQADLKGSGGKDEAVLDKILAREERKPVIRSIELTETYHEEVEEPLTAEEKKETEQMVEEEQLRRTDFAAYSKLIQQKQAKALDNLALHQAQLLGLRPGSDTTAPFPSTVQMTMPRATLAEADRRVSLPITASATSTQAMSARRVDMPSGQAIVVPNLEPVLGPNTRVEQRSLSEALDEVRSPKIGKLSASGRAESEPINEGLSEEIRKNRDSTRRRNRTILEVAFLKQVELGQLAVKSVSDVAESLATSTERHAYRGAKDGAHYKQILEASLGQLVIPGQVTRALVTRTEEKLASKSARVRRFVAPSQPPASPRVSNSGDRPLAENVSSRSTTPATSTDAERVRSFIHPPLSETPDLAQFPSLAGMLQREANRKTG